MKTMDEPFDGSDAHLLPDSDTPQVDCLIALVMAEHPRMHQIATYYEVVHQELASLARQLERDARRYRKRLQQLRLDVLSVMPENWREDPDWVALVDEQKLMPNAELTGAARLYHAASRDRGERG